MAGELLIQQLSDFSNPETVNQLEREMLKAPQESCPVIHRFGPGIYIREVHLKAGCFVIGHHQNKEHLNVMLKGKMALFSNSGIVELSGASIFVGQPGRKIAYIYEDVAFLNIYNTHETDVEKLEAEFITKSENFDIAKLQHEAETFAIEVNKLDYKKAIEEFGFTENQVQKIVTDDSDLIELPFGAYKIKLGDSVIHGKGLFATSPIAAGEFIAPARYRGKRTIAGRYTNHSISPNAKMVKSSDINGEIDLIAVNDIKGCVGGFDGEEITIDYREALKLTKELGAS